MKQGKVVDAFRRLHPTARGAYTYWSMRTNAVCLWLGLMVRVQLAYGFWSRDRDKVRFTYFSRVVEACAIRQKSATGVHVSVREKISELY